MSAEIYTVWNVYCSECAEGDGPHDYAEDAEAWQRQHDAEYHDLAELADTRAMDDADHHRKGE